MMVKKILFLSLLFVSAFALATVVTYPSDHSNSDILKSDIYRVTISQSGEMYQTMVYKSQSNGRINSGARNQSVYDNSISWLNFSFSGTVTVRVELLNNQTLVGNYNNAIIRPLSDQITPQKVSNKILEFELSEPGQYSVEFNQNAHKQGLMIFADKLETRAKPTGSQTKVCNPCTANDLQNLSGKNAIVFKDNYHNIGDYILPTNIKKVYIEGGAVVAGTIRLMNNNNDNTIIYGRGILDGRKLFDQNQNNKRHAIESIGGVSGTTVEGITVSQAGAFFIRLLGTENKMNWIKTIGGWIFNNDGLVGYENTEITNSFVWADDDGIKLYRDNTIVENVVMWHLTNGACFQWAWNTIDTKNVRVSNVDVIHTEWPSDGQNQGVFNCRGSSTNQGIKTQQDWVFDQIRVESATQILFNLAPQVKHNIKDIVFKNITASTKNNVINRLAGKDAGHKISNVKFQNVKINGTCLTNANKSSIANFQLTNTQNIAFSCNTTTNPSSTIKTFNYPTNLNQAFESNKYDVFVKSGNNPEQKLQVLMSDVNYRTMYKGDFKSNELKDRTFSFVHLDYDVSKGETLTFRIVKKYGINSSEAVLSPKSYGYNPNLVSGKEIKFSMKENQKYISVNFKGSDNETANHKWIKHMLCIFVDPPETNKPNKQDSDVVTYSNNLSASALQNASVIYFPAGYHNLKNHHNNSPIDNRGILTIKSNQSVYLEGGAFVEGVIKRSAYQDVNQKVFGRGILTGRQYYWSSHPNYNEPSEIRQLIELGNNAEVTGIMYMESPNHGLTGRSVHVSNVKFLGWHSNHDGVRVGSGSEIENSFLRAVDDHFYNFNIHVHDCVLWAGHNGAILTYGWGGEQGSNNYQAGSSLIENIDIINPEWTGLGNNNGLIMSQLGFNHEVSDYGTGDKTTIMRNIRVEGIIPAITNLKPRSNSNGNIAVQVSNNSVTYLGDLLLENVSIEEQFTKGLIRGEANASFDGNKKWLIKNVEMKNITIAGDCITEANKNQYFNIDENTVDNLVFTGCETETTILPENNFSNIVQNDVLQGTTEIKSFAFDENYGNNHGDGISQINYQIFDANNLSEALGFVPATEFPYQWTLNTLDYPNGEYQLRSGAISLDENEKKWTVINITIANTVTGKVDFHMKSNISVYPNPVNDIITIKGEINKWQLYTLNGQMLKNGNTNTVDVKTLEKGLYLLSINGQKYKVTKQ